MSNDVRIYFRMSGLAVKGLQRLVGGRRDIFVRDDIHGFTVVTRPRSPGVLERDR